MNKLKENPNIKESMELREMKNKRIFVYDTTKEFSEFITKQYTNDFAIDVCTSPNWVENYNYSAYDIFFIIVKEPKDMIILFKTINNAHSVLFLVSALKEIKNNFQESKRVISLDIFQNKSKMKRVIDLKIAI